MLGRERIRLANDLLTLAASMSRRLASRKAQWNPKEWTAQKDQQQHDQDRHAVHVGTSRRHGVGLAVGTQDHGTLATEVVKADDLLCLLLATSFLDILLLWHWFDNGRIHDDRAFVLLVC